MTKFPVSASAGRKARGSDRMRGSAPYGAHSPSRSEPTRGVRRWLTLLACVLGLMPVASRQLAAIRVSADDDLQAVLDKVRPGETVLLAPGAHFVGNFVLPNHGGQSFVTLRTDGETLPEEGTRTGPEWSGQLAVIQSPDAAPALRTAPAAHHWRVENIEFKASRAGGEGDIISLGEGGREQRHIDDVPHDLILDRLYIHGDAVNGQKRGIALNSRATHIVNSHISDIKAIGQDAQAIAGWNGPGDYVIENNFLEASGEVVLFGGADPGIDGLVPSRITMRRNHLTRPQSWRDAILLQPEGVRGSVASAGGALRAGAYSYTVVAERPATGGRVQSAASNPVTVSVGSGTGMVALEWQPVPEATAYRVYRRGPAIAEQWFATQSTHFTDTGGTGTEGSPRAAGVWTVKNLLELKNARDVLIEGNLLERHWRQAQNGYAILFTPRNQDGRAPWSRIEGVRFINNVVRDVAAGINLSGTDDVHPSGRTRDIVIANNLFLRVDGGRWGGNGDFIQIGHAPEGITIERNTVVHTGRILSLHGSHLGSEVPDLVFRRNVVRHNQYGVIGGDAGPGQDTFNKYLPGAVFTGNVIAGGRASSYPRGNIFVGVDEFEAVFTNSAGGDYRTRAPYAEAGADISAVERAVGVSTTAPVETGRRLRSTR